MRSSPVCNCKFSPCAHKCTQRCQAKHLSCQSTCCYFMIHVVLLHQVLAGVHSISWTSESLYLCMGNGDDLQDEACVFQDQEAL
jgi:hypothetical protein